MIMMMKKVTVLGCFLSIVTIVNCEDVNPTSAICSVPEKFEYGQIRVDNSSEILIIECIDGFKAYPSDKLTCSEFNTTAKAPKCIKTCPSVEATHTAIPVCKFNNVNTSCERPYENSVAIFQCKNEYYENRNNEVRVFTCRHGKWNAEPNYECQPVCGLRNAKAQELLIGGEAAKRHEFPWHLGIFKGTRNICGGVLIAPRIILTAAHCFKYDPDPKLYLVAGGKVYRDLTHPLDEHVQYSKVLNISTPTEYYVEGDSRNDIAILLLDDPFIMNAYTQTACIDKNPHFNNEVLVDANPGVLTGWGYTEGNGAPSEYLKVLEVDYKTASECTLRFDFKKYYFPFVHDKICAGHYNKGLSACKGDSGGGLVFQSANGRYYVRGIVSITPNYRAGCDANQYTLYTSIVYHIGFILKEIEKFELIMLTEDKPAKNETTNHPGGCIVPILKNGAYYHRQELKKAGSIIPNVTWLEPVCNQGFSLLTFTNTGRLPISCSNNTYFNVKNEPFNSGHECRLTCPTIDQKTINVTCFLDDEKVSCDNYYDGMTVSFHCKNYYTDVIRATDNPYRYCFDGSWNHEFPRCTRTCATNFDKVVKEHQSDANVDGQHGRFLPWHVSIFEKDTKKYLCSGSLVTPELVVTSDCFLNANTMQLVIQFANEESTKYHVVDRIHLIEVQLKIYALLIEWQEITDVVQPACNMGHTERYFQNQTGYFINTIISNGTNGTHFSYNFVPFHFREYKHCGVNGESWYRIVTGTCIEIIGNPTCTNIRGSGVIYPDSDGRHHFLAVVDSITNCSSKFTTVTYTHLPDDKLKQFSRYFEKVKERIYAD